MKRGVVIAASFAITLGLYIIYASLSMSIWKDIPEEGFFPLGLGLSLVVLSSILLMQVAKETNQGDTPVEHQGNYSKVISYALVLILYSLAFSSLGFLVSTAIALTVILKWIEHESWRTTLLIALGFTILSYLLFASLLGVSLPKGLFQTFA